MDLQKVSCPSCSQENFDQVYQDSPSRMVRCRNCDLVFFNPLPSEELLERYYSSQSGYLPSIEENLRSFESNPDAWKGSADFILNKLSTFLPFCQGQRLIDVGAAYGFFLTFAKKRGYESTGIEISTQTSQYATDHGIAVINTPFLKANLQAEYYDIITMNNVLEHTLKPLSELEKAMQILKSEGLIYIAVPNFGSLVARVDNYFWKMKSWPNHLFYFTEQTLTGMLNKVGFKVCEVFTHQGESNLNDDIRVVRERLFLTDDSYIREIIKTLWKVRLGQELVMIARKG